MDEHAKVSSINYSQNNYSKVLNLVQEDFFYRKSVFGENSIVLFFLGEGSELAAREQRLPHHKFRKTLA
ncbi:hypothetical protein C6495_01935 [Candidatus Poribacteria bacterium]|nr:MAG: hypothetical protein C6495_01935 [Candidatus Poribacteria bacterium]